MPIVLAALSTLLWALALPFLWLHPKMRGPMQQRFGNGPKMPPKAPGQVRIWLHGASAGDVLALAPTARALRSQQARCELIITTLTGSGLTMARQQGALFDGVLLSPMDTPWTVRRALRRLDPDLMVLEYTELWPQLILGANALGVPLALHNGRFGAGRRWRYRLLFALTGNLLRRLDLLLMRDDAQSASAVALARPARAVITTGNTKFDNLRRVPDGARVAALQALLALAPHSPVLVLGSTHEGEEEMLISTFVALLCDIPTLRLIVAPRYVERAERLRALCARHGLTVALRQPQEDAADKQVLILNTVGELTACYQLATVVFVGGSFVARGGQNILEPAALGKPVVFGPNMSNFTDAVAVLAGRGGIQTQTPAQLQRVLLDLLRQPDTAAQLGRVAQTQVQAVSGAAARNARHLLELLARAKGASRGAAHHLLLAFLLF